MNTKIEVEKTPAEQFITWLTNLYRYYFSTRQWVWEKMPLVNGCHANMIVIWAKRDTAFVSDDFLQADPEWQREVMTTLTRNGYKFCVLANIRADRVNMGTFSL